jgi:hypothetical protein
VKTIGLATAPTYELQFWGASGQNLSSTLIAAVLSEPYSYVSGYLAPTEILAGTALLEVRLGLAKVSSGRALLRRHRGRAGPVRGAGRLALRGSRPVLGRDSPAVEEPPELTRNGGLQEDRNAVGL